MKPTLEQLVAVAKRTAETAFRENGEVRPLFMVHTDREVLSVPGLMDSPEAKDTTAYLVRTVAAAVDACAIVFMFEGYYTRIDKRTNKKGERTEAVHLVVEHFSRRVPLCLRATIVRQVPGDESTPGVLGPWLEDDGVATAGRFANLLPGAGTN